MYILRHLLSCYPHSWSFTRFRGCFWSVVICIGDGCLESYIPLDFSTFFTPRRVPNVCWWFGKPAACISATLPDAEEEGTTLLRNVGNYLPVDTASHHHKTPIFSSTAVRTSKLVSFFFLDLLDQTFWVFFSKTCFNIFLTANIFAERSELASWIFLTLVCLFLY